jgi:thiol-disulfide isomerase/thioredoxin
MHKAAILALLGVDLGAAPQKPASWESEAAEFEGIAAPAFTLALRGSSPMHIPESGGKAVAVLTFFASWCIPCRAEAPVLNA